MKSKGLGDTIEKITKATGIKAVVETISTITNVPCGCSKRREALNKAVPYENMGTKLTKEF
jgi:hypothetical protein|tara:strand:+ start:5912 stop:6094 length:183 start_codon:yes stop_codon:yes gene_type:complete